MSVADSKKLMEIIGMSDEEVTARAATFKKGPEAALDQLKRLQKDQVVQVKRLQDLLHNPAEEKKALAIKDEQVFIKQWFESKESYDWIDLPYSQLLQVKHLTTFNFHSKGQHLTSMDLRGAKNMQEQGFIALYEQCPNLQYLNISEWAIKQLGYLVKVQTGLFSEQLVLTKDKVIFPCLKRVIVANCKQLEAIDVHLPAIKSLEAAGNSKLTKFALTAPCLKLLDLTDHQIETEKNFYLNTDSDANLALKNISAFPNRIINAFVIGYTSGKGRCCLMDYQTDFWGPTLGINLEKVSFMYKDTIPIELRLWILSDVTSFDSVARGYFVKLAPYVFIFDCPTIFDKDTKFYSDAANCRFFPVGFEKSFEIIKKRLKLIKSVERAYKPKLLITYSTNGEYDPEIKTKIENLKKEESFNGHIEYNYTHPDQAREREKVFNWICENVRETHTLKIGV